MQAQICTDKIYSLRSYKKIASDALPNSFGVIRTSSHFEHCVRLAPRSEGLCGKEIVFEC